MPLTMFDDVTLSLIPKNAAAVASYVNGRYANHTLALAMFPNAEHLSIAVTSHADADCLDIERGDAINADAPAWVKRQLARGVHRPAVYTSLSNVQALLKVLAAAGIPRSAVRLWSAHYTGREHICGPVCALRLRMIMLRKADATQWTDRALNKSLDRSLCRDDFFHAAPTPVPVPAPKPPVLPHRIVRGYRIARHLIGGVWYTVVERVFGQAK